MNKFVYGIDLGGTNIKVGLFSTNPIKLTMKKSVATPTENQEETIFSKIVEVINAMNLERGLSFDNVIGVGIAVPCPIIAGEIGICPNIALNHINVEHELAKLLPKGIIITASNDANMAALGEFRNAKEDYTNAAFYTLGTGVGGGLIINKEIVEGKHGTGGEFGHIKVFDKMDTTCGCGSNGCLEQLAGTAGLIEFAKRYMVYESSILQDKKLTVKAIFDAAKVGDSVGVKVVDKALNALAMSASIIAVTADPDVFIIGGGVSNAGQFLIDRITHFYKKHARFNTGQIPFILAKLKNDAGMYGAAYHLHDKDNNA